MQTGKSFQGLSQIRKSDNAVAFEATIPDSRSTMPKSYESDYIIHPTTFDSVLQAMLAAVRTTEGVTRQAWVPTSLDSIHISVDIPSDPGSVLRGICKTSLVSNHQLWGKIMAGDGSFDSLPWLIMDNIYAAGLGASSKPSQLSDETSAKLYASVSWKPDLDLVQGPGLQRLLADAARASDADMAQFCSSGHSIVNEMCRMALEKLDASPRPLPHHLQKHVHWMRRRCVTGAGSSLTPPLSPRVESPRPGAADNQDWGIAGLRDFVDKYPVDGELLRHTFASLDAIYAQQTTSIAALMASDSYVRSHKDSHGVCVSTRALQSWFDLKAHKVPSLRVIEIGAGTASSTLPVLKQLSDQEGETPRLSKWTFTDVSPGWFEGAKGLLNEWKSFVEYKVLDIDKDPVEQGFEAESYDVVLAANVSCVLVSHAAILTMRCRCCTPPETSGRLSPTAGAC